jgi:hypothetical protein
MPLVPPVMSATFRVETAFSSTHLTTVTILAMRDSPLLRTTHYAAFSCNCFSAARCIFPLMPFGNFFRNKILSDTMILPDALPINAVLGSMLGYRE